MFVFENYKREKKGMAIKSMMNSDLQIEIISIEDLNTRGTEIDRDTSKSQKLF